MFDIIGYWVTASVLTLPLILAPAYFIINHFNNVLGKHTEYRHQVQAVKWIERNCSEGVAATILMISIFEWIFFIITTAHYYAVEGDRHDYLVAVNHLSKVMAPVVSWMLVVGCFLVASHYAVIGYAKVLNMSDKLKDKGKDHV